MVFIVNIIKQEVVIEESLKKKSKTRFYKKRNLFNKREIEKANKHLNDEMNEAAEEFYKVKKTMA